MTTPIERAGNALMRNRAYQAGVAFGVPDETEAEAKHRAEIVKAVLDSIDIDELEEVIWRHLPPNVDPALIALAVKNWLRIHPGAPEERGTQMKKITTERELFELPIGSVVKTADRYEDGELDYRGDVLVLEEEGWLFDNCCGRHMGAAELWKSDGEGGLFLLYRPEEVNQ